MFWRCMLMEQKWKLINIDEYGYVYMYPKCGEYADVAEPRDLPKYCSNCKERILREGE